MANLAVFLLSDAAGPMTGALIDQEQRVIGRRREPTVGLRDLGPASLDRLPAAVRRPGYDRSALRPGMAHIGVGAFHRCHQAEFTDDMLEARFDRWGIVGINLRPPVLAETLGRQDGLYTRVLRSGDARDARVIGCLLATVDAQASPDPALAVLADPAIDVATITVTEKGYCHRPATGALDPGHPDIRHDLAHPEAPRSLPGLLARALDLRRADARPPDHARSAATTSPATAPSSPASSAPSPSAAPASPTGSTTNAAFPSTMVDRIVPATTAADLAALERAYGYRDAAAVGGEPFRQWVIENRFAGRTPPWDLAGATFVDDVTPFEQLKMRVLNAAQSTLAYLGVLAGHAHTCDAIADPLPRSLHPPHARSTESVPTLAPVPGIAPLAYVEQSLARLHNTAIRHRCHQIATDGSQKLPQRLVNPAAERLARGEPIPPPHGRDRRLDGLARPRLRPLRPPVAGRGPRGRPRRRHRRPHRRRRRRRSTAGILALDTVFDPALAAREDFRQPLAARPRRPALAATRWPSVRRAHGGMMKLGLLTAPFPDTPLLEVADWARSAGFEALEIACWPRASGPTRRYAGTSHIDVANLSAAEGKELVAALAETRPRHLRPRLLSEPAPPGPRPPRGRDRPPEAGHRRRQPHGRRPRQHLLRRRRRRSTSTPTGRMRSTVWPDIIAHARDHGVKLAFENCPMIFSDRRMAGRPQHRLFAARSGAASSRPGAATSA